MNINIDLSRFLKYCHTRIQELTHPGCSEAFSRIDWSKYSEEIVQSLREFYADIKKRCEGHNHDLPFIDRLLELGAALDLAETSQAKSLLK